MIKPLLACCILSLLSACKLVVIVEEGGGVQSASGLRDCTTVGTCEFEVSDTSFSDSFTALPGSGFQFVRWQDGGGFLCGNSVNPVCPLSNTNLEGNAGAEAFIASDEAVTIKPIFERVSAPRYVIREANGDIVGDVISIREPYGASVKLVYLDEGGVEHGYAVLFTKDAVFPIQSIDGHHSEQTCTSDSIYIKNSGLENGYNYGWDPLFSSNYIVVREADETLHLARFEPYDYPAHVQTYYGNPCSSVGGSATYVPATIVVRDILSQFSLPFSIHSE